MNWIDGITLILISVAALYGLLRGFIREAFGILCWIGAFFFAGQLSPAILPAVESLVKTKGDTLSVISWTVAFVGLLIVFSLSASLLASRVLLPLFGGFFNHILGAVIGAAKGFLVVCIFYLVASGFISQENWSLLTQGSVSNAYVQPYALLLEKYGAHALHYLPTGQTLLPSGLSGQTPAPEGNQERGNQEGG
ncbi:CvpA family protein [Entomobacter blattae]|uniref:Colicin V production protein n=1 Tax=Entomobacter blattae TaxID=2762277 RepID=A0A7H1NQY5_9PROT|nr:CvpA family protein [Entomobacter blattae]QNT78195.1 Colicin V production protein [Entomobacter blattae]